MCDSKTTRPRLHRQPAEHLVGQRLEAGVVADGPARPPAHRLAGPDPEPVGLPGHLRSRPVVRRLLEREVQLGRHERLDVAGGQATEPAADPDRAGPATIAGSMLNGVTFVSPSLLISSRRSQIGTALVERPDGAGTGRRGAVVQPVTRRSVQSVTRWVRRAGGPGCAPTRRARGSRVGAVEPPELVDHRALEVQAAPLDPGGGHLVVEVEPARTAAGGSPSR